MLKLIYYVPDENLEETKKAILQQVRVVLGSIPIVPGKFWELDNLSHSKAQILILGKLASWKSGRMAGRNSCA